PMYADHLSGLLSAEDFARIYQRTSRERRALEERKRELSQQPACPISAQDRAHALVQQFLQTLDSNRALLVSLIARVELTQDKEIILYFRFHAPEAIF
ncbi:MAG: resolvase, partial [Butyricicoccus pullicaecorum]